MGMVLVLEPGLPTCFISCLYLIAPYLYWLLSLPLPGLLVEDLVTSNIPQNLALLCLCLYVGCVWSHSYTSSLLFEALVFGS